MLVLLQIVLMVFNFLSFIYTSNNTHQFFASNDCPQQQWAPEACWWWAHSLCPPGRPHAAPWIAQSACNTHAPLGYFAHSSMWQTLWHIFQIDPSLKFVIIFKVLIAVNKPSSFIDPFPGILHITNHIYINIQPYWISNKVQNQLYLLKTLIVIKSMPSR